MQITSLIAHEKDHSSWREKVLYALQRNICGMTSSEIMYYYDVVDPNKVRPRLTDLRKEGKILEVGIRGDELIWQIV